MDGVAVQPEQGELPSRNGEERGNADRGYCKLRVPELRGLCEHRGLSNSGFKQALVARLEEQDSGVGPPKPGFTEPVTAASAMPKEAPSAESLLTRQLPSSNAEPGGAHQEANVAEVAEPSAPPSAPDEPRQSESDGDVTLVSVVQAPGASAKAVATSASTGLSEDEVALRSLLKFFVCSDVQRRASATPLPLKYHEFVNVAHEVITGASSASSAPPRPSLNNEAPAALRADGSKKRTAPNGCVEEGWKRSKVLRRKAEQAMVAQFSVHHLTARREALAAQLKDVRQLRDQKTAERLQLSEQLELLVQKDASRRARVKEHVQLQVRRWLHGPKAMQKTALEKSSSSLTAEAVPDEDATV
eukprot:gnl/TRDRNA2_/TRDRNA2_196860_c0_seq1.p1 gnl/TRDRNA2_/TRDRNA2_196860_c0~~gnl/TRDRNA2_/TRDRNA2_196860_c0_seq1.p1  ORF type:complete len:373 (+),score=92.26 gnl/TRDRNA2_/TRDRNA2_196860_c0_seq1:44-1120(+)